MKTKALNFLHLKIVATMEEMCIRIDVPDEISHLFRKKVFGSFKLAYDEIKRIESAEIRARKQLIR